MEWKSIGVFEGLPHLRSVLFLMFWRFVVPFNRLLVWVVLIAKIGEYEIILATDFEAFTLTEHPSTFIF
jgi:hypothetical protein